MMVRRRNAGQLLDGSDLDQRSGPPRGVLRRRVPAPAAWVTIGTAVLISMASGGIAWAANRINTSKLDTDRFVLDSARREELRREDRMLLERIDSRVGEMYCARIPSAERGGCR